MHTTIQTSKTYLHHMSIVAAAAVVESHHSVVYVKTEDGEVHAVEFGSHEAAAPAHNHHDKLHDEHNKHAQTHAKGHEHHHEADGGAQHETVSKYHVWSPVTVAPETRGLRGAVAGLTWKPVGGAVSIAALTADLKADHHAHHAQAAFTDATAFAAHVLGDKLHVQ